jgi:hypothetical protein
MSERKASEELILNKIAQENQRNNKCDKHDATLIGFQVGVMQFEPVIKSLQAENERLKNELWVEKDANKKSEIHHKVIRQKLKAEITRLGEAAEELRDALQEIDRHCLCRRNTNGFDYGETHRKLGAPRAGSRWLTPGDMVELSLARYDEIMKGGKDEQ